MRTTPVPVAEITATAIRVLCRELGVVNTARFLNQFTTGLGNYTEQRDQILGETTVEELIREIHLKRKRRGRSQPARRPTRPTRRRPT